MNDFQNALGQYLLYRDFLNFSHKNYELYLAVKSSVFNSFFSKKIYTGSHQTLWG